MRKYKNYGRIMEGAWALCSACSPLIEARKRDEELSLTTEDKGWRADVNHIDSLLKEWADNIRDFLDYI